MKKSNDTQKTNRKKLKYVIVLFVLLIDVLTAVVLWKNGVFQKKDEEEPFVYPLVYLCAPDYNENIFEDADYMSLDRRLEYIDGNEDHIIETNSDCVGFPVAKFFLSYFDTVINGKAEIYNSMFTSDYISKSGKKDVFTMQKIYEMQAKRVYIASDENKKNPSGVTSYRFEVSYKIKDNNGTFKNDLRSDTARPQLYEIFVYENGDILINSISDIIPR